MKDFIHTNWISFFIVIVPLIFFKCHKVNSRVSVEILSEKDQSVGLSIDGVKEEKNISNYLKVQLIQARERTPILGNFKRKGETIIFEPLVPFTQGLRYEVLLNDSTISEFQIPLSNQPSPHVLAIYPTQDTLPENLLKVYLHFSQPMTEGNSLRHIFFLKNDVDTMKGAFLDLQPELWNSEGTVLTLWLDPGRIKRDLIPNKELGTPLLAGNHYTLIIANSWKSKNGQSLENTYLKTFFAAGRDDNSPDPSQWKIISPLAGTRTSLKINLREALDYHILKEGTSVVDENKNQIAGVVEIMDEEKTICFIPDKQWSKGKFILYVESRLEDLSGNNLNRPFDRDIEKKALTQEKEFFTNEFEIK